MTTAIDINTGTIVTVKPIAIYGSDAFDTLLIADANGDRYTLVEA